jgi:hypothetical protein
MRERRFKIAIELIHETKNLLSDVRDSAGPATSESLKKVETFLTDLEKEIAPDTPKESWLSRTAKLTVALGLLVALDKLLLELGPEAIKVIGQFLKK